MGAFRLSAVAAVCSTVVAIIFCCVGLFSKTWWQQYVPNNDRTFGLFTVLNCTNDLCVLAQPGSSNEGFILFEQAAALIQFVMLIIATGLQVLGFICGNQVLVIAASGSLGLSCASSVLQVCVLSKKYLALSEAYMTTVQQPMGYVVYETLPLGLCALSGSLCIPAFVCLIIYRTEERRMRLKSTNE